MTDFWAIDGQCHSNPHEGGRQIAEEMQDVPPHQMAETMQSVGDPGRALALLSSVSGRIRRIMLERH